MGLAPPTPYQWQVGDIGSAALLNAQLYDGLTFLLNPPAFSGYQNTVQSLTSSTWTGLNIDVTNYDNYSGHSNTTNPSRYVAQVAGTYTCCGVYAPAGNATGIRAVRLQKNGSPVLGASVYAPAYGTVEMGVATPTVDIPLLLGDYVEVAGWQSSGAALNTILDVDLRCGLWVRFSHL